MTRTVQGQATRAFSAVWAMVIALPALLGGAAPIETAKEAFSLAGVDQGQFDRLVDRRPWSKEDEDVLLRVLFRLGQFPPDRIARWADAPPDWTALIEKPQSCRAKFFRLRGVVESVETVRLPQETAHRFEFGQYHRVVLQPDGTDAPRRVVILALDVPKAWRSGKQINQPGEVEGLFLKLENTGRIHSIGKFGKEEAVPKKDDTGEARTDAGDSQTADATPVFAARRVAWHPDNLLGRLGMDVGLLDDLTDRKGLGDSSVPEAVRRGERECFYEMLAAVGSAKPGELFQAAQAAARQEGKRNQEASDSVVPLFNEPSMQRGKLFLLRGTARRVLRVRVDESDVVARWGIDHYFEIDLFTDDSQNNPIVFCVRDLPEGMPTGEGRDYAEDVALAGFFVKSWAFRSEATMDRAGSPKQLAPLLIGQQPVWRPVSKAERHGPFVIAATGLAALVLLATVVVVWRFRRGDEAFGRWKRRRAAESVEPIESFDVDMVGPRDNPSR